MAGLSGDEAYALSKKHTDKVVEGIVGGDYENTLDIVKVNDEPLSIDPKDKSVNVTVPTKVSELENDSEFITGEKLSNYALASESGYELGLEIDPITYLMTLELKNKTGETLSERTIDFPLESMVIGAEYADGELTLKLQNGTTLDPINISDIVGGLVKESFTIAGIDMKNDITKEELISALGIDNKVGKDEIISVTHGGTGHSTADAASQELLNGLIQNDTDIVDTNQIIVLMNPDKTTRKFIKKPISAIWNWIKSKLATVATSGSYNDLTDTPNFEDTQGINILKGTNGGKRWREDIGSDGVADLNYSTEDQNEVATLTVTTPSSAFCIFYYLMQNGHGLETLKSDTEYTVSFWYKTNMAISDLTCSIRQSNSTNIISNTLDFNITNDEQWHLVKVNLTTHSAIVLNNQVLYFSAFSETGYFSVRNLKMEEGIVENPMWSPSPYDVVDLQNNKANSADLAEVAKTGSYNDLVDKPNQDVHIKNIIKPTTMTNGSITFEQFNYQQLRKDLNVEWSYLLAILRISEYVIHVPPGTGYPISDVDVLPRLMNTGGTKHYVYPVIMENFNNSSTTSHYFDYYPIIGAGTSRYAYDDKQVMYYSVYPIFRLGSTYKNDDTVLVDSGDISLYSLEGIISPLKLLANNNYLTKIASLSPDSDIPVTIQATFELSMVYKIKE